jgi:hypothetical protein
MFTSLDPNASKREQLTLDNSNGDSTLQGKGSRIHTQSELVTMMGMEKSKRIPESSTPKYQETK